MNTVDDVLLQYTTRNDLTDMSETTVTQSREDQTGAPNGAAADHGRRYRMIALFNCAVAHCSTSRTAKAMPSHAVQSRDYIGCGSR